MMEKAAGGRTYTILIVDDEEINRVLLSRLLEGHGYRTRQAENGRTALLQISRELPDLVLLDLEMPEMNGLELVGRLKGMDSTRTIPTIIVTGNADRESRLQALRGGAEDFLTKPVDDAELTIRVRNHLRLKEYGDLLRDYAVTLERQVVERTSELRLSHRETIYLLTSAAEFRDEDTGAHIRRVAKLTSAIARAMGMERNYVDRIFFASPMHDIGKIAVPDNILLKAGPLEREEWEIMKSHATYGRQILERGTGDYVRMGAEIAWTHHERWDGSGYPRGLRGQEIPLSGSIMSICDSYDALRSRRPYKRPFTHEETVRIITDGDTRTDPRHFRPEVLGAFQSCLEELRGIYDADGDGADAGDPGRRESAAVDPAQKAAT